MTKQELFDLLDNLDKADQNDIDRLDSLLHWFPYFQTTPILQARIAEQIGSIDKNKLITRAALYTADRTNLKNLLEGRIRLAKPEIAADLEVVEKPEKPEVVPAAKTHSTAPIAMENKPLEGDDNTSSELLYKEVMKNLETLRALREKYEFLEELEEKTETDSQKKNTTSKKTAKASATTKKKGSSKASTVKNKTKKTQKKETDKDEETPGPSPEANKEEQLSGIDLEEQNQLIESFIKNESEFSRKKPDNTVENKHDLSEKSTTIGDEIISENLAEIMKDQGKAEKAIEIYRKLIWKFPQKKAYFASRIEELTNK